MHLEKETALGQNEILVGEIVVFETGERPRGEGLTPQNSCAGKGRMRGKKRKRDDEPDRERKERVRRIERLIARPAKAGGRTGMRVRFKSSAGV